ncbi:MAG: PAS domain-containing protein [Verrucomicrobia bacterium]|nr:PAS domain-containing protein [Verrucomicrobiota bacterium]
MDDDVLISMTDLAGKLTFANNTFCRLAEYTNEELVGSPHNIVRHPDMPKGVFADLWQNLRAGKMWQGHVKNRSKTGRFYWVLAAVFPHYRGDQILGYISVRVRPNAASLPRVIEIYRRIP